jgi:hypothetical protein
MSHKTNLLAGIVTIVIAAGGSRVALAQIDLTGNWAPLMHEDQIERVAGPDAGDYAGLPITDAARLRADSWSASLLTLPEHQCKPHPSTYGFRGVGNLRIRTIIDDKTEAIIGYTTHIQWQEQKRTIWMDGRPHPPDYAAHTWQGFSTGQWSGNILRVRTTHLKAGWIRRNGLPLSDKAMMTDLFIVHDDVLTHVYIIEDPTYLTEPLIRTNGFLRQSRDEMQPYPCDYVVEVLRPRGQVPHNLAGTNDASKEYAGAHRLPVEGVRGGAETALPEFMLKYKNPPEGGAGKR